MEYIYLLVQLYVILSFCSREANTRNFWAVQIYTALLPTHAHRAFSYQFPLKIEIEIPCALDSMFWSVKMMQMSTTRVDENWSYYFDFFDYFL